MSGRQLSAARRGLAPDAGDAGYCAGGVLEVLEVPCVQKIFRNDFTGRPGEDYPSSELGKYGGSLGWLVHPVASRGNFLAEKNNARGE